MNEQVTLLNSFTYDNSLNPVLNNINPKNISVSGDVVITIEGSAFQNGVHLPIVTIGDKVCGYISHNATHIQCIAPDNHVGMMEVVVDVPQRGSTKTMINYFLNVFDYNPKCGSLVGGTSVTINGEGFGDNATNIEVLIGKFPCKVVNNTQTEINCVTMSATKTISVDNSGTHSGKLNFTIFRLNVSLYH